MNVHKASVTAPRTSLNATPSTVGSARPRDSCSICLEPISERAITAPCNHALFDYLCILTWLLEHNAKCPLCKTDVTAVSYDFVDSTSFKTVQIPKRSEQDRQDVCRADADVSSVRRRSRRRQHSPSPPAIDPAVAFRKHVYRHSLYSLHIGANRISKHRNFTPRDFANSSGMQARARKWIRRELRVFEFLQPDQEVEGPGSRSVNNAEFLLEYIMAMLRNVDIKDSSGHAEHLLREFLGRKCARLFLHELEAWLRSPFGDIRDWDDIVQYPDCTSVEEAHGTRAMK